MTQKVATEPKMKSGQETTSFGQIATVTAKPRICEMLTEKLNNCNGFFTTQRYPPFSKIPTETKNFRSISDSDVKLL